MHALILSAGPSLVETYDPSRGGADLVIAVNAAAGLFPCDAWCAGDTQTVLAVEPAADPDTGALPALLTMDRHADRVDDNTPLGRALGRLPRVVGWPDVVRDLDTPRPAATDFSLCVALVWAVRQGADTVTVHGHDAVGSTDCLGREIGKRVALWGKVAASWNATRAWALGRGVGVFEVRPEPAGVAP